MFGDFFPPKKCYITCIFLIVKSAVCGGPVLLKCPHCAEPHFKLFNPSAQYIDEPGESICQGDSGSAVGKIENEKFILYGVISFTANDCTSGYPTGYTEVGK